MDGERVRVLAATDVYSQERCANAPFSAAGAGPQISDPRTGIYTARIAAGLMVHEFSRWIRHLPVHREVHLDLLSGEWTLV